MRTSLKIALIGFPGNEGKKILEEALSRGYCVKVGNINPPDLLGMMLKEQDLIVSRVQDADHDRDVLMKAVLLSGVKKYLVFGGVSTPVEIISSDDLIVEKNGKTSVSYEEFVIALLDEIEASCHPKDHFTI